MSRNFDNADWLIDLNMGNIQGHADYYKSGNNPNVSSSAPEDIWPEGGDMNWPTAAQKLTVVSDDTTDDVGNTGARKVMVHGLDANYDIVTETVSLDGTTPVDTTTSFLRAFRSYVTEVGSNETNAGTIDFQWKDDANDAMSILPGVGQTAHCGFTLPANYKGFVTTLDAFIENATTSAGEIQLWTRVYNESSNNNYESWRCVYVTTITTTGNSVVNKEFKSMFDLSEKMDVRLRTSVTVDATVVGARLEYFLMDTTFFN